MGILIWFDSILKWFQMQDVAKVERHAVNKANLINLQKIKQCIHTEALGKMKKQNKNNSSMIWSYLEKRQDKHTKKRNYQNKTGSRNKEGKGSNTSTKQR